MIEITSFGGQNWLITPAALAVNEAPPASIGAQKWLLVLSGVGLVNFQGASNWHRDSLHLMPDLSGPLNYAINRHGIPRPPGQENGQYYTSFQVEQWSPMVGLASIFDESTAVNAGFAVDSWRPSPFVTGTDAVTHVPVGNIFSGIIADIATRDTDAWLYRVNYNITLLGRIVFNEVVII